MKLVPVIMRCFFFSLNIVTGAYNYMVWNFILTSCDVFALLLAKTNYLYSGLLFFLCQSNKECTVDKHRQHFLCERRCLQGEMNAVWCHQEQVSERQNRGFSVTKE